MGGDFVATFIGAIVVVVLVNAARIWWMMRLGGHGRKIGRIADGDDHLSFDERIAERMRELERDKALATPISPTAPSSAPLASNPAPRPTFGRRSI